MTAVAPAFKAARANPRWRAFSVVDRSTPQWNVATTTSARRRAARTPAETAGMDANEVPGLAGPAANEAGPMSEKPTKATRRPRRLTTTGRRAAASVAPAPTATAPARRTERTVSSKAPLP